MWSFLQITRFLAPLTDASTVEGRIITPKNASCHLSQKSAIFAKASPMWWPTVQSKHSSCHRDLRGNQQPPLQEKKRTWATPPSLPTALISRGRLSGKHKHQSKSFNGKLLLELTQVFLFQTAEMNVAAHFCTLARKFKTIECYITIISIFISDSHLGKMSALQLCYLGIHTNDLGGTRYFRWIIMKQRADLTKTSNSEIIFCLNDFYFLP